MKDFLAAMRPPPHAARTILILLEIASGRRVDCLRKMNA